MYSIHYKEFHLSNTFYVVRILFNVLLKVKTVKCANLPNIQHSQYTSIKFQNHGGIENSVSVARLTNSDRHHCDIFEGYQ